MLKFLNKIMYIAGQFLIRWILAFGGALLAINLLFIAFGVDVPTLADRAVVVFINGTAIGLIIFAASWTGKQLYTIFL